jgi:hypothetical protein
MNSVQIKAAKPAARKAGRKASGLRDLPPEAARLAVSRAALELLEAGREATPVEVKAVTRRAVTVVEGAVTLQREARQVGAGGGAPTLERLLRGDVEMASIKVVDDGQVRMQPVVRGDATGSRLKAAGVPEDLRWTAERFLGDVEAATIGRLTASYGEGLGGGRAAEPERLVVSLDRLARAQAVLTPKERTAVWAHLVFGLSLTDTGWAVNGERSGSRKEPLIAAGLIFVEAGLERMHPHYQARGEES